MSRKVHITLVGGQPDPVYNVIYATNPELIEFVYSDKTKVVMERISKEINNPIEQSAPLSATNLKEIQGRANALAAKYADDEVTLNISGGTKSWSHFFDVAFANHPNCHTVYIDQNNTLYDLTNVKSAKVTIPIDIYRIFRLHGNEHAEFREISEYTLEDATAMEEIEGLYNHRNKSIREKFKHLFTLNADALYDKMNSEPESGSYTDPTDGRSTVDWETFHNYDTEMTAIDICLYDDAGNKYECHIESPNAVQLLFNSGWFEYKIAQGLLGWKRLNKNGKIWLNCRFRDENEALDKNEVDVILSTGDKLVFVECKTRIYNTTDLDKFNTVMHTYGGLACKGLFFTRQLPNWATEKAKLIEEMAKDKCREHGILFFDISDNTNWSDIFGILNKEIEQINAR